MRKRLIFFVPMFLLTFIFLSFNSLAWWNSSWQYRKQITITNPGSNSLTDYQINLHIDTRIFISENKMNEDCSDIRFTWYNESSGEEIKIPYWIESGCNTSNTSIWIKVPYIPANGNATVYMYYGNPSAESESKMWNNITHLGIYGGVFDYNISLMQRLTGKVISVATGGYHTCILLSNGNVECYGLNNDGRANDYLGGDAIGVAAGWSHTCVLLSNGNVDCYGYNGDGRANDYLGGDAIGVAVGVGHTCVLLENHSVHCYGSNNYGEASDYLGSDAIGMALGWHHTCILLSNGTVHCYGDNSYGQSNDYLGGDAIGVAAGLFHTCILLANGTVHCYGYNEHGEANDYLGGDAIGVAAYGYKTCILLSNGTVHCYGYNYNGDANNYLGGDSIGVSAGYYHTCVLLANGTVHCYGANIYGQSNDYTKGDAKNPFRKYSFPEPAYSMEKEINEPPHYSSVQEHHPNIYSPYSITEINITWEDNVGSPLDKVLLEINYTGSFINYTISNSTYGGNVYTFRKNLPAGTFCWRSYASDTYPSWNSTPQHCFTINKAAPYLNISLSSSAFTYLSPEWENAWVYFDYSADNPLPWRGYRDDKLIENTSGLVLRISGDEVWGSSIKDSSGHGNDGTFYGKALNDGTLKDSNANNDDGNTPPQWVDGKFGKALMFDGVDDYVEVPDSESLNFDGLKHASFSVWIKLGNTTTYYGPIVSYENANGHAGFSLLYVPSVERLQFWMEIPSAYGHVDYIVDDKEKWIHVVGVWDAPYQRLYVNGKLIGEVKRVDEGLLPLVSFDIGKWGNYYYAGIIDEVRIYNRALSEDEIKAIYENNSFIKQGLVAYWKFDEGKGIIAHDSHHLAKGKFGYALEFDGENDYVEIPDSKSLDIEKLTVTAWIKRNSDEKNHEIVMKYRYSNKPGWRLRIYKGWQWGIYILDDEGNLATQMVTKKYELGKWLFVSATITKTRVKLYVNGELIMDKPVEGITGSIISDIPLYIGSYAGYANFFNGTIDEVRIYNRILSDDEIRELYLMGLNRLAAGTYKYILNVSETQNYTSASVSAILTINKGILAGSLSGSDATYPNDLTVTFTENNVGDADVVYKLYRNDTWVADNPSTITEDLGAGTYVYKVNSTGGQNWTANSSIAAITLTISKGPVNVDIYFSGNGTSVKNQNYWIREDMLLNVTVCTNITRKEQINANNFKLWQNGTEVGSLNLENKCIVYSAYLPPGTYYFNASFLGNQNYTSFTRDPYVFVYRKPRPPSREIGGGGGAPSEGIIYVPSENETVYFPTLNLTITFPVTIVPKEKMVLIIEKDGKIFFNQTIEKPIELKLPKGNFTFIFKNEKGEKMVKHLQVNSPTFFEVSIAGKPFKQTEKPSPSIDYALIAKIVIVLGVAYLIYIYWDKIKEKLEEVAWQLKLVK